MAASGPLKQTSTTVVIVAGGDSMSSNNCAQMFVRDDGRPLKFRIQPNLEPRLRQHLENIIKIHGGAVISNVPVRGFVVVDPESVVGKALIGEWAWVERPERRFVSTTFMQSCVDAKALLPIGDDGMPRMPLSQKTSFAVAPTKESKFIRPPISDEQKLELTRYLAKVDTENCTSNQTFRNLVAQSTKFVWVGTSPWQAFRNDYFKDKRSYDRRIKEILKRKERAVSQAKFVDLRNAALRISSTPLANVKHLDLREIAASTSKSAETSYMEKSARVEPIDMDDIRCLSFLESALEKSRQDHDRSGSSQGNSLRRKDHTSHDDKGGTPSTRSFQPGTDSLQLSSLFDDNDLFSEALAKEARLTVDEVKQKLASFSGDRERAREFLIRCRQTIDDLFLQNFEGPSSISQA